MSEWDLSQSRAQSSTMAASLSSQQWPLSQVGRWYKRSLTGSQGTSVVQPTMLALLFACSALSTERRQGDRGIQEVSLGPEC